MDRVSMQGFERVLGRRGRGATSRSLLVALLMVVACATVQAVDVGLAGVFPGKALLTIDGGAPRTVAVGATTDEGVRVLAVDRETATIESEGKKRILRVGQYVVASPSSQAGSRAVLTADGNGHFVTTGNINGTTVRFLVDTGATMVSLGASDARRIGIDSSKGLPAMVNTANGQAAVSRVRLDTVRVGEIVLHRIDALIHQQNMPFVLLGMTFLNHLEMQREGQTMTLRKRY